MSMGTCPDCDKPRATNSRFCPRCGSTSETPSSWGWLQFWWLQFWLAVTVGVYFAATWLLDASVERLLLLANS